MAKADKDPRDVDRDAELAKQKAVADAVAASNEATRKEAEAALQAQRDKEQGIHNIKVVEGKP